MASWAGAAVGAASGARPPAARPAWTGLGAGARCKGTHLGGGGRGGSSATSSTAPRRGVPAGGGGGPSAAGTDRVRPPDPLGIAFDGAWPTARPPRAASGAGPAELLAAP
eukprot:9011870-Alexandrium_andersonii.AAC.1